MWAFQTEVGCVGDVVRWNGVWCGVLWVRAWPVVV